MSEENAELANVRLVEAYYPALNARDVEAVLALFAEDDTWEYLRAEPHTYEASVGSSSSATFACAANAAAWRLTLPPPGCGRSAPTRQ